MENPKIRFKEFTKDWEQRKVSELCSISTGKSNTQDKVEDGEYPFYVRSPIIERSTKYLYDEEAVLTVGDGVGTGKVFHYVNGKYDLHQRCYRMYDFTDELNAHYFYHTFSKLFYKRVMAMTAKTSVDSVRLEMIADMEIPVPKIDEQIKIGAYFDNLDHLITLHQRKCEQTKKLKKYMLQKMFPQNGAKVPEIRFYGFTYDWEQRKLSELLEKYEDPVETPHDGYERVGIRSHAKGTFHSFVEPGKELDTAKMYRVAADKFILNITFAWEHAVAITDNNDAGKLVSHRFPQFSFNPKLKPHFFKYLMLDKKFREHLELSSPGGAGRNRVLKISDMLKYEIKLPSIEEQIKIGEYFDSLDYLITLHQRKCDELKKMKKYMLQNMFI